MFVRSTALALLCLVPTTARAQHPPFDEIIAPLQQGAEALERGDTAAYLEGSARSYRLAPTTPVIAYHHARALALSGSADSALGILARLARADAVVAFEARADSAFRRLRADPRFRSIAARIDRARAPVSHSRPAFELAERDLIPEGTAYDTGTRTLYLTSFYKRKVVAVSANGTARDFTAAGQDGLGAAVGLEVDPRRRELWVASMHLPDVPIPLADSTYLGAGVLHRYDLATGRLIRRYVVPPGPVRRHAFNDLTILPNGDVYVTDSDAGALYVVPARSDSVVEVLPPGTYLFPNGITQDDTGRLLFIAHAGGIDRMGPSTRRPERLAVPDSLDVSWIDGLAYYRGSLIAHQPSNQQRVIRLYLDGSRSAVSRSEIIERHHPRFAQPTTGEVAGDTYYYIANAQLRRFRDGKIFPPDQLDPVLILRADLRTPR